MRANKAIAVSGCLLHQSLMAVDCEVAPAFIRPVVDWALDNDIGLVPWTCPETMFAGLPRKTKGIERYRREGLAEVSNEIATGFADYLERQLAGGIDILAIVGVSFSPACSVARQAYHANEQGLFITALKCLMGEDCPPIIDINRRHPPEVLRAKLDALLRSEVKVGLGDF